jgi:FAD/FMN-containing dehydrogenase
VEQTFDADVRNWFGDLRQHAAVVVTARSVADIVAVMQDRETYPSPVRAVGSNHSTTRCAIADGGTIVDVSQMTDIVDVGEDTVTTQAGALYIDVAEELERRGLQFFVNVELGNLTMGSAATGGTKDASMPDEFGQVGSYAIVIKMVTPTGELIEFDEGDPELLTIARSSYGLFGIVYEVTFRVRPFRPMRMWHRVYKVKDFVRRLPQLQAQGDSMMFYFLPFLDRVGVEFRRYQPEGRVKSRWQWWIRNLVWSKVNPAFSRTISRYVPFRRLQSGLVNAFNWVNVFMLNRVLRGSHTSPLDQMIRYPERGGYGSYTFSIWAFPEADYPDTLLAYYRFCRQYYRETGYRCDMLNVGYRIAADRSSLFSYSWDGDVMTLDPVSTGQPGWDEFLQAYNRFCSDRGGVPLFNQTKHITTEQSRLAFGDRLDTFEETRRRYDPQDRLLNDYFRQMLQ